MQFRALAEQFDMLDAVHSGGRATLPQSDGLTPPKFEPRFRGGNSGHSFENALREILTA